MGLNVIPDVTERQQLPKALITMKPRLTRRIVGLKSAIIVVLIQLHIHMGGRRERSE